MPLDILKSVQLSYDYSQIKGAHVNVVIQAAMEIKPRLKRAAQDVYAIGEQLNTVKDLIPHGQWADWLNVEFELTDRTARNFMAVADRFAGKTEIISDLPPTALYLLAAPSTPDAVVEDVTAKAAAGERVRVADVKQAISAAKPTASVDDLTRHIGSWLSQQTGKPIDLLTSAAVRSHSTRHQLELFLGRRDVTFKREDIEAAIAQVANNVVKTGAANTELRGPMPTMTHKDVEDLKARHAAPPTDNTSLSVEPQTPMSKSLSLNMVGNAERLAAVRKVIASQPEAASTILDDLLEGRRGWYHDAILCYCDDTTPEEWQRIARQAATPSPLQGRSGDDLIKQYESDGWKVNRTDDGWQAIHHHDQVATPVFGNVAELLDALDDGNFAEEFYFLDEDPAKEELPIITAEPPTYREIARFVQTTCDEMVAEIQEVAEEAALLKIYDINVSLKEAIRHLQFAALLSKGQAL